MIEVVGFLVFLASIFVPGFVISVNVEIARKSWLLLFPSSFIIGTTILTSIMLFTGYFGFGFPIQPILLTLIAICCPLLLLAYSRGFLRLPELNRQNIVNRINKESRFSILVGFIIIMSVFYVILMNSFFPPQPGDGMAIWDLKGFAFYIDQTLDPVYLSRPEHPLYTPLLHAWGYSLMGSTTWQFMHIYSLYFIIWILLLYYAAETIAISTMARDMTIGLGATTPSILSTVTSAYVDFLIIIPSLLGVLLLIDIFRSTERKPYHSNLRIENGIIIGVLFGLSAWMKTEGFVISIVGVIISIVIFWKIRGRYHIRRILSQISVLLFGVIIVALPWIVIRSIFGIESQLTSSLENIKINLQVLLEVIGVTTQHLFTIDYSIYEYGPIQLPVISFRNSILWYILIPICLYLAAMLVKQRLARNGDFQTPNTSENELHYAKFSTLVFSLLIVLGILVVVATMYLSSNEVGGPYNLEGAGGQYETTLDRLLMHVTPLVPLLIFSFDYYRGKLMINEKQNIL